MFIQIAGYFCLQYKGDPSTKRQTSFDPAKTSKKAPMRFELMISCLLDRRFNQLSHGANYHFCSHIHDVTHPLKLFQGLFILPQTKLQNGNK